MEFALKSFCLFLISDSLSWKGFLQPLPISECIMRLFDLNIIARDKSKKWDDFETTVSTNHLL